MLEVPKAVQWLMRDYDNIDISQSFLSHTSIFLSQRQLEAAVKYLQQEMGQNVNRASREKIPISLSKSEMSEYIKRFNYLDTDKKGYISLNDLRASLKVRCRQYIIFLHGYLQIFLHTQVFCPWCPCPQYAFSS